MRAEQPKKRRWGNLISTLMIVVGLGLIVTAAVIYGRAQWRYHKQAKVNEYLAGFVTLNEDESGSIVDAEGNPQPPTVDWAGLKAINDDVIAWLRIPGTQINYPIYQADDNDRYLRNTATGEYSVGGQLFNDYECTRPGMVDMLTLTYGHHMFDGSMFQTIAEMDVQENFDAIDLVWYVTEKSAYQLEPLLLYYTTPDDESVRVFKWGSADEFHAYLNELLGKAVTMRADAAERIQGTDHVLALITCNYYEDYGRTILICAPKQSTGE